MLSEYILDWSSISVVITNAVTVHIRLVLYLCSCHQYNYNVLFCGRLMACQCHCHKYYSMWQAIQPSVLNVTNITVCGGLVGSLHWMSPILQYVAGWLAVCWMSPILQYVAGYSAVYAECHQYCSIWRAGWQSMLNVTNITVCGGLVGSLCWISPILQCVTGRSAVYTECHQYYSVWLAVHFSSYHEYGHSGRRAFYAVVTNITVCGGLANLVAVTSMVTVWGRHSVQLSPILQCVAGWRSL